MAFDRPHPVKNEVQTRCKEVGLLNVLFSARWDQTRCYCIDFAVYSVSVHIKSTHSAF